jgi:Zn-dependent protease with chaperone function
MYCLPFLNDRARNIFPMAMDREKFATLVEELENAARRNPIAYKVRVGLLALLGYGYLLAILGGFLAIAISFIALILYTHSINSGILQFFLFISIPAWIAGRSLWESFALRFPAPSGLLLDPLTVPRLFALVGELTQALKCPTFDRILLTSDFNAAVVQIPKGFILGGHKNYLLIGLPLLQAVSPQEFRAILAHEFGHLSSNHNQFDGWIYRMRQTWGKVLTRLQQTQQDAPILIFKRFFEWYVPFFDAYSFVLARADEYEADCCAALLAGNKVTATALVATSVRAFFLEESFWTRIYQKVNTHPDPPQKLFTRMADEFKIAIQPENERQWLQLALNFRTNLVDTHPCLSDRLQALGIAPENAFSLLVALEQSAADFFLGDALSSLTEQLEQEWQSAIAFRWREQHSQMQQMQRQLQALEQKRRDRNLSFDEVWNLARLTARLKSNQQTILLLRNVLERRADFAPANYLLGQILLEEGDETGIYYLEAAMSNDREIVLDGCRQIYYFLCRMGKEAEAEFYRQRAQKQYEWQKLANEERSHVSDRDRFQPHQLSLETLQAFRRQLTNYPDVREAYLVQKVIRYFPQKPFYVLGIKRQKNFLKFDGDRQDLILVNRLADELKCPGETWIVILNDRNRNLEKQIKKVTNEPIYSLDFK